MASMRQTAAEIDHAILDVAADIFATHGFAHTSVQQVADAVGYSKPGLLHRFGSKETLYRQVMAEVEETVDGLVDQVAALGEDPAALSQVVEVVVRQALSRPGVAHLALAASHPTAPGPERTTVAGRRLVDALDQPLGRPADRLRVVLALQLVVTAALAQHDPLDADLRVPADELVPLVRDLALGVLRPHD